MAIRSFRLSNMKALHLAECPEVPGLMIISGPNGVGKSTLLHALKQRYGQVNGDGRILYMGPHRAWRRQKVRAMHLHNQELDFRQLLTQDSLGSVEGIALYNNLRTPDSLDEAHSLIKYTLAQIETRRQAAITEVYDRGFMGGERIDVYEPLRSLVGILLPHLKFDRLSLENKDNVVCLFTRTDAPTQSPVDIDDLSSGEKAVISLLLPFLEEAINRKIMTLRGEKGDDEPDDLVCIIDEPELHLHPTLQDKLLDYFRRVVNEGNVQFIISTHSPVIIKSATLDELYMMLPAQGPFYNQLVPAVSELSRVEAIRSLTGDTFGFTSGRPLVLIEGANPIDLKDEPSDIRLIQLLSPQFQRYTLLSLGSKERVRHLAGALDTLLQAGQGSVAFAITDLDQLPTTFVSGDRVLTWPVAMIENFLLIPEAIYATLEPYREVTGFSSPTQIRHQLLDLAAGQVEEELRLRIAQRFQPFRWSFQGTTVEGLLANLEQAKHKMDELFGEKRALERTIEEIHGDLETTRNSHQILQRFHGKLILKSFFAKYVQRTGLKYKAFCIEIARTVGRMSEPEGMRQIRHSIDTHIPVRLHSLLEGLVRLSEAWPFLGTLQPLVSQVEAASSIRDARTSQDNLRLKSALLETIHEVTLAMNRANNPVDPAIWGKVEEVHRLSLAIMTQ